MDYKTESNYISGTMTHSIIHNDKFGIFDDDMSLTEVYSNYFDDERLPVVPEIANSGSKRLYCHLRLSVVVAIAQVSFFELIVAENHTFAVEIVIVSVVVQDI